MPMRRYEIRNEFGLGDPELYRSADKDDPEVLLEGIAMAGLVGVLRQLGDLAEFAAEIFYDLHEDVMATAARGHDLMARVQQLEAEVPLMEKSFVSQTIHTPLFTNSGVEWRANIHLHQNLITGDVPRFVMDSCEECRGPPRLFLLDKFDVAGAGACLKRYTDPAFFKIEAESTGMPTSDTQREKKSRKLKKRSTRLKVETEENSNASNPKLHQLFSEERVGNGLSHASPHVKLKKRPLMAESQMDAKTGKSYKDKLLELILQQSTMVHTESVESSVALTLDDSSESGNDIHEIGMTSPLRNSIERKDIRVSSDMPEQEMPEARLDETIDMIAGRILVNAPECSSENDTDESSLKIPVNADGETVIQDGIHSEDCSSEIDNYMDALNSAESENETDNEGKSLGNETAFIVGNHETIFGGSDEHGNIQLSDSQLITNSPELLERNYNVARGRCSSSNESLIHFDEDTVSDAEEIDESLIGKYSSVNVVDVSLNNGSYVSGNETCDLGSLSVPRETSGNLQSLPIKATSEDDFLFSECVEKSSSRMETPSFGLDCQDKCTNDYKMDKERFCDKDEIGTMQPTDTLKECVLVAYERNKSEAGHPQPSDFFVREDNTFDIDTVTVPTIEDVHSAYLVDSEDATAIQNLDYLNLSCDTSGIGDNIELKTEIARTEEQGISEFSNDLDVKSDGLLSEEDKLSKNVQSLTTSSSLGLPYDVKGQTSSFTEVIDELVGTTTLEDYLVLDELNFSGTEALNTDLINVSSCMASVISNVVAHPNAGIISQESVMPLPNQFCEIRSSLPDPIMTVDGKLNTESSSLKCESDDLKVGPANDDIFLDSNTVVFNQFARSTEAMYKDSPPNIDEFVTSLEQEDLILTESMIEAETALDVVSMVPSTSANEESHTISTEDTFNMERSLGDAIFIVNSGSKTLQSMEYHSSQLQQQSMNIDMHGLSDMRLLHNPTEFNSENGGPEPICVAIEHEVPHGLPQFCVDEMIRSPPDSIVSSPTLLHEICTSMEDVPPLPPLPPMQWRMTKTQVVPLSLRREGHDQSLDSLLMKYSGNPFSGSMTPDILDSSAPSNDFSGEELQQVSNASSEQKEVNIRESENNYQVEEIRSSKPDLTSLELSKESDHDFQGIEQHVLPSLVPQVPLPHTLGGETMEIDKKDQPLPFNIPSLEPPSISPLAPNTNPSTSTSVLDLPERHLENLSLNEINFRDSSSDDLASVESQPNGNAEPVDGNKSLSTNTLTLPPTYVVGKLIGSRKPLPRNPLIDAVAALDKTKLRKVATQTVPKLEERNSMLEQIRTKSFNLKPASTARPNIQGIPGPKTNLKVAAILEKANAIRQALAGSDEDEDSDSWSDS